MQGRRQPDDVERFTMPADWVVVRCADRRSSVEIAMASSTLTGFLSWIEAAPPGLVVAPAGRAAPLGPACRHARTTETGPIDRDRRA